MAGNVNTIVNKSLVIEVGTKQYECCISYTINPNETSYGIVLTHGAGGDMNNKQLVGVSEKLADSGYLVLRFTCKGLNLGYRTRVFAGIVANFKEMYPHLKGCFVGGRSMGSRAAVGMCCDKSMIDFIKGVICLSYPLHKPKDNKQLRDGPLYEVGKSILFVSGTKDEMCCQEIFLPILEQLSKYDIHWVEGGNHGLEVKEKQNGDIVIEICHVINTWIQKTLDNIKRTKKRKWDNNKS